MVSHRRKKLNYIFLITVFIFSVTMYLKYISPKNRQGRSNMTVQEYKKAYLAAHGMINESKPALAPSSSPTPSPVVRNEDSRSQEQRITIFAQRAIDDKIKYKAKETPSPIKLADQTFADIQTPKGSIIILLDTKLSPKTSQNFVELAEGTKRNGFLSQARLSDRPFFDGLLIFRVVKDYFIQMGDPQNDGRGGPGYDIPMENVTPGYNIEEGAVVMAQNYNGNSGSQFIIALRNMEKLLGKTNTVFGKVVVGLNVARNISEVSVDFYDQPLVPIHMEKVVIRRVYREKINRGGQSREHK